MQELAHLDRRLKRIDFYYGREAFENEINKIAEEKEKKRKTAPKSNIVCKYFLDAVKKKDYGRQKPQSAGSTGGKDCDGTADQFCAAGR